MSSIVGRFEAVSEAFESLECRGRVELLVDFGSSVRQLPLAWSLERDKGNHIVTECQAPVFLKAESKDSFVVVHADVPVEAPVARGFVGLLVNLFDGLAASEVTSAPSDLLTELGLAGCLSFQRQNGLAGIYRKLRSDLE